MHRFLENIMKRSISNENSTSPEGGNARAKRNSFSRKAHARHVPTHPPKLVLGKIYADWCGHCRELQPKWEIIENELPKRFPPNSPPLVYKVEDANMDDSATGLATMKQYLSNPDEKVELQQGYPTIFKIVNGKVSYYDGPREVMPIISWAMKGIGEPKILKSKSISKSKSKTKNMYKGGKHRMSRHTRRR